MITTSKNKESMISIGNYYKKKRLDAGLSQQQVADTLGYTSPQHVSNWERGLIMPSMETTQVLVVVYKINKNELMEFLVSEYKNSLGILLKQIKPVSVKAKAKKKTINYASMRKKRQSNIKKILEKNC